MSGESPFSSANPFARSSHAGMQAVNEEDEGDCAPNMGTTVPPTSSSSSSSQPIPASSSKSTSVSSASTAVESSPFSNFTGFSSTAPSRAMSASMAVGASTSLDTPPMPSNYNFNRRTSVSAESLNPATTMNDKWTPPVYPKTNEQQVRLNRAVSHNFLFSHLDEEQSALVLGALQEKKIPAKGVKIIEQGAEGDMFYVVESGKFDVYVHSSGSIQAGSDGLGEKVGSVGACGSFGELALMYNAPRAASVVSSEPSTVWALDRMTFRRILMDSAFQRRRMYESFLEEVPLLAELTPYERSKIADALEMQKFPAGIKIICEGDVGEAFYILESGTAEVYKNEVEGPVLSYKKGDYFGELALLDDAPRAASVVSKTDVKVATLSKDGFQRLLGPVESLMRRNDPRKKEQPQTQQQLSAYEQMSKDTSMKEDDADLDPLSS